MLKLSLSLLNTHIIFLSGNNRGFSTIFTSLTRSLGSDTDILPSNAESSKQNRGRATGGYNVITFRAPRIKGKFSNYVAKLHYILKCAAGFRLWASQHKRVIHLKWLHSHFNFMAIVISRICESVWAW